LIDNIISIAFQFIYHRTVFKTLYFYCILLFIINCTIFYYLYYWNCDIWIFWKE